MREALYVVLDLSNILVGLILLGATIFTGVRCSQKKQAPLAAWILVIAFAVGLISDLGFFVTSTFVAKTFGLTTYRIVMIGFRLFGLLQMLIAAGAIALFVAKPLPGKELSHG